MCNTDQSGRTTFLGIPLGSGSPQKSSQDLAAAAELERQRMSLSTKGFSANYKKTGGAEGDTSVPVINKVVLGK